MPALLGASAEFIPNHSLPHYSNEVIKLSAITADSILAGHIVGGIFSPQENPFSSNQTGITNAHPTVYEVWLVKNTGGSTTEPILFQRGCFLILQSMTSS